MNDNRRMLTIKEAANYLGRSENAIRILISRNEISSNQGLVKIGRRSFFDKNRLDQYLDNLTTNG